MFHALMWVMEFTLNDALCQVLSSQLSMEAMSFVTEDRKTAQESTFPNTYTFDLFGGVDVSLTLLVSCWWSLIHVKNQLSCSGTSHAETL